MSENLYRLIRDVPDFPKPGILFRDITPLLEDSAGLKEAVEALAAPARGLGITRVAAIESRGFILGAPVAVALGAGLVLIRKPGKLPGALHRMEYALEYGTDSLEMHTDALRPGERTLVVDDVLATGGTAAAAGDLVQKAGAEVAGFSFLIELAPLGGRARLHHGAVHAVLTYPREA